MFFLDLKTQLKQRFFPILHVYGEDAFLRQKALEQITASLNISLPEMNIQKYTSETALMESIINSCNTMAFSSDKKLVSVSGYPAGVKGISQPALVKAKERLTQYAAAPNPDCCLVFVTETDNDFFNVFGIDKVICDKQDKSMLIRWITTKVSQSNRSISTQTAGVLADYCLRDMSRISRETDKLISLIDSGEITTQMVDQLVYRDMEYVIFDFLDSVAEKKNEKALDILDRMLDSGEKPMILFRRLYDSYRRMFYCSIYRADNAELAKLLRCKEYPIIKAKAEAKLYSAVQLKKAVDMFSDIDNRTNSVRITEDDLKLLVLKLLNI